MHLSDYTNAPRHSATLIASTRITPPAAEEEVKELILEIDEPRFVYQVGQSVAVLVPGPHPLGEAEHLRLYTIANPPETAVTGKPRITLCVKRCTYIDEYSGEQYQGIASHYLCSLPIGERLMLSGPFGLPFEIPAERDANLLMIGLGTGIAPFRAFVKHIYEELGGWEGKVRLFYGARTGLETLYMNDERDDFAQYYDRETFEAYKALSPRPHWGVPPALGSALAQHRSEVWQLINRHNTYVYIAGLAEIRQMLELAFSDITGSEEKWARRKAELVAGKRWVELIY